MARVTCRMRVSVAMGLSIRSGCRWSPPNRWMTCSARTRNAGPDTKALTMKRGAKRAVFQKGRPPRPLNKNAVTAWMLTAQAMLR